jgi:hypothetical protein
LGHWQLPLFREALVPLFRVHGVIGGSKSFGRGGTEPVRGKHRYKALFFGTDALCHRQLPLFREALALLFRVHGVIGSVLESSEILIRKGAVSRNRIVEVVNAEFQPPLAEPLKASLSDGNNSGEGNKYFR